MTKNLGAIMQIQRGSPMEWVINAIPTRYVDSPLTVVVDLAKVTAVFASIKYIGMPIVKSEIARKLACTVISLAVGPLYLGWIYYNDNTPTQKPVQIRVKAGSSPGPSPFNTFL